MPKVTLLDGTFDPAVHTLVFTHIPKCGGTSLHETLTSLLGRDHYRVFAGAADEREEMSVLHGGGGHQKFGNNPLHEGREGLVYVTVLRDPLERFRSFFHHVRRAGHPLQQRNPAVAKMAPRQLIAYLEATDEAAFTNVSNHAASMLAPRAKSSREAIDHVERNYSLVGIFEDMTNFLDGLGRMFPGKTVETFELNKTSDVMEKITLDNPLLIERVREINKLDYALYEHFRGKSA